MQKNTALHELFRNVRTNFCLLSCDTSQVPNGNCSENLFRWDELFYFGWICWFPEDLEDILTFWPEVLICILQLLVRNWPNSLYTLQVKTHRMLQFAANFRRHVNREVQTVNWEAGKEGAVEANVKRGLQKAHKARIRGKNGAQTVN